MKKAARLFLVASCLITNAAQAQFSPGAAGPPPSPPAVAPPLADALTGPAKAEYEAGKLLYRDGDFAGALI